MIRPLVQIDDVVREMNDAEYAEWQAQEEERGRILAESVRLERNKLLFECDWRVMKAVEDGTVVDLNWATYRQTLRDIPQQAGFPTNIDWPVKPE
jgi:hypothetical protein